MTKRKNKVFLYQDYIHNSGVLYKRLVETFGNVLLCDADDIAAGALDQNVSLFVMPGGADLYYAEKLNGKGNEYIRDYIESGGNYLGICAGAYYGAREIDWNQGEISGVRELALADVKATGPIYEFLEDNDIARSWKNIVDVTIDGEIYPTVYIGGPIFDAPGFATYSSGQSAIVRLQVSKGTVILTSPHIEYTPELLGKTLYRNQNRSYEWETDKLEKFSKRYHSERDLWSRVLKEFK